MEYHLKLRVKGIYFMEMKAKAREKIQDRLGKGQRNSTQERGHTCDRCLLVQHSVHNVVLVICISLTKADY